MVDIYKSLGISPFSSEAEIEKAIQLNNLAKEINLNDAQNARAFLLDPEKRRAYDKQLTASYKDVKFKKYDIRYSPKFLQDRIAEDLEKAAEDDPLRRLVERASLVDPSVKIQESVRAGALKAERSRAAVADAIRALAAFAVGMGLIYGVAFFALDTDKGPQQNRTIQSIDQRWR